MIVRNVPQMSFIAAPRVLGSKEATTIVTRGVTQYTSFLAVDQVVRNKAPADSTSVNQPSPLPQGVENSALGAEVPSTPEPATWGAILVTLSVLAMLANRRRRAQTRAHHYTS